MYGSDYICNIWNVTFIVHFTRFIKYIFYIKNVIHNSAVSHQEDDIHLQVQ